MEGTKYKISGFFPQENIYPTTNDATASSSDESSHNAYLSQWQPQLLGMYHLKVACVLLGTCRLEIFNPGTPSLSSAPSVTLAPELTQKPCVLYTLATHNRQMAAEHYWTCENQDRDMPVSTSRLLRSHHTAGWSQQPQGIKWICPPFWSLTQTFLCIQLINALS